MDNVIDEVDEVDYVECDEVEVEVEIVIDDFEWTEVEIDENDLINDVMQLIVDEVDEVELIDKELELGEKLSFVIKQIEVVELIVLLDEQ